MQKKQKRVLILGVPVDCVDRAEADGLLRAMAEEPRFHHVATPNNEMLVAAARNDGFRALLLRTDLNLPDSTGLLWASRFVGCPLLERVTGVDSVVRFCMAMGPEHPVFFLGAAPGVAESAARALRVQNPRLVIAGAFAGSPREVDAPAILDRIRASGAHVLFVAYGAPTQDLWIDRYRRQLPGVRLAMGVGGTFDFVAGTRKRAPAWMQRVGLEWAWRLIQEPRRIGRIWTAVVVFPWMVVTRRRG